jgi:hypothetical protein
MRFFIFSILSAVLFLASLSVAQAAKSYPTTIEQDGTSFNVTVVRHVPNIYTVWVQHRCFDAEGTVISLAFAPVVWPAGSGGVGSSGTAGPFDCSSLEGFDSWEAFALDFHGGRISEVLTGD